ncbi:phosphatidylinositol 3 and 4-kinase-domain-containing protein [Gorgonomyces haynaldii]|nr:phosphatidylinositol 3 and 4-kinase-domain-containing protein [Gorgonomyces haynaldii]
MPTDDEYFYDVVDSVREAIAQGIYPVRIPKGSSGSYFCRNPEGEIVGVFKPRDEEPYARLNPKWVKFLQRNIFFCCFGRNCIIPNTGYLSEACASLIDRRLGLGIVPRTQVVELSSPSFFYSFSERWQHRLFGKELPLKQGSFQLFLRGYVDSTTFFNRGYQSYAAIGFSDQDQAEFRRGFERLVILDYLIRNTDRGSDNWMIKYTPDPSPSKSTDTLHPSVPRVQVAAIDNGLAFPFQHPNRIRSYPYGWQYLPIARLPFSQETCQEFLPLLTSDSWWHSLLVEIEDLYRLDPLFSHTLFSKQKSVLRGQSYNLVQSLAKALKQSNEGPLDLVGRELILVHEGLEATGWDMVEERIERLKRIAIFKSC